MRGYRKKYRKDWGRNCYNCFSKIWNSQCGYNGSGIGNGEQAVTCKDYARTCIGTWIKDCITKRKRKRNENILP
jgi:hypothetical protein